MSRKAMVVPTQVTVTAETEPVKPTQEKERRRSHRIVCRCGSSDVRVSNTITRDVGPYPAFMTKKRESFVKRKCVCGKCGHEWWRRSRETEEELGA